MQLKQLKRNVIYSPSIKMDADIINDIINYQHSTSCTYLKDVNSKERNNGRDVSFSHLEVWQINFQLHDQEVTHAK